MEQFYSNESIYDLWLNIIAVRYSLYVNGFYIQFNSFSFFFIKDKRIVEKEKK